ncbi:hypothetical protein BT69DRAFT_128515 [Atractiella rhizophila]|nr:hypothetical protein BT69DRAFT_128515 [Atractiella rhizophila]
MRLRQVLSQKLQFPSKSSPKSHLYDRAHHRLTLRHAQPHGSCSASQLFPNKARIVPNRPKSQTELDRASAPLRTPDPQNSLRLSLTRQMMISVNQTPFAGPSKACSRELPRGVDFEMDTSFEGWKDDEIIDFDIQR